MFRFRLAKVLRYRSRLVDEQSRHLKEARLGLRRLQQEREVLQAEIEAVARRGDNFRRRGQMVQLWRYWTGYLAALRQRVGEVRGREEAAGAEVARQRERLLARQRDKEVLQKLAARQEAQWLMDQQRRERRQMDEVGAIRFTQRGRTDLSDEGQEFP